MRSLKERNPLPASLARSFQISATPNFHFRDTLQEAEMSASPTACATILANDFAHVVSEKQKPREARRQHAAHLNQPLLSRRYRCQCQRVADNHICKRRDVLVPTRTIWVNDADILDHSVIIDDAIGSTSKHGGDITDEDVLGNGLGLQSLPSATVQHMHVRQLQRQAATPQRSN